MKSKGFTLVELIVVILILAVLGVSAYTSNNIFSSGYSVVTEQHQVISLLRTVQNRAMQNTQANSCQAVYISSPNIGLAAQNNLGNCQSSFVTAAGSVDDYLNIQLDNSFTVVDDDSNELTSIAFDNWGRPELFDAFNNRIGATVTIAGTHSVVIESQGYIHGR